MDHDTSLERPAAVSATAFAGGARGLHASPRPADLSQFLSSGQLTERYCVQSQLGIGSVGSVFAATCENRKTGQTAAVTVMHEASAGLPTATVDRRLAFLQTVYILRLISELRSPNLPRLLDAFEEPQLGSGVPRIYLVTEFCAGGDVRRQTRSGALQSHARGSSQLPVLIACVTVVNLLCSYLTDWRAAVWLSQRWRLPGSLQRLHERFSSCIVWVSSTVISNGEPL